MARALWEVLEGVPDRREASGRRYPLAAILAITIAAMLAGRTSLAAIARWGRQLDREALRALGIARARDRARSGSRALGIARARDRAPPSAVPQHLPLRVLRPRG